MDYNYTIRSKINVKPKKGSLIFKILLNISLIIIVIISIITIICEGLKLGTISHLIIAFGVVTTFKSNPKVNEHYEFSLVDISIDSNTIMLTYRQVEAYKYKDYKVSIPISNIHCLEYSDRLCCLHIEGNMTSEIVGDEKSKNELLNQYLYLEKDTAEEIILNIQGISNIPIKYMDR